MDAALALLTVQVHVLDLTERVAARDAGAEAEAMALAELLAPERDARPTT